MIADLLLTLAGLLVLVAGAEGMIRGAVELALRARISPLVVGLTVVSIGTSAPELSVSLLAALKGSSAIAVGNVVGSNIANLALVLGLCVLVYPIEVDRAALRVHWPVMMLVSIAFTAMVWDDLVLRVEGALLVAALVLYITWMVIASRREQKAAGHHPVALKVPLWRSLVLLAGGIAGLTFGADWFTEGAIGLSRSMGVSDQLIGVTVVAVGTSLPELVTSLMAALRKQADISLGNLIGSNIFNLLGIIGASALVKPILQPHVPFITDLGFMLGVALLLLPLMAFATRLGRWQGALLLGVYVAYMVLVFLRG
jgi:cation:H+ antiporter